jgi:hypothetical protein
MKPICIDLYCGLGGWSEAFIVEGYECIGYDIEAHDYGSGGYPGKLILRDVRSIHGSEFKNAAIIVGSSPCQEFSYRAMPWSRAKALGPPYLGIELFNAQFRIQREASEAAGRHIPMVVENVRGAQKWVGRAAWHYGSFYLWGDVPALMPMTFKGTKLPGNNSPRKWEDREIQRLCDATKTVGHANIRDGHSHTRHLTNQRESDAYKTSGMNWSNRELKGQDFTRIAGKQSESKPNSRKAASAMIAKIPYPLAQHIARTYKPA